MSIFDAAMAYAARGDAARHPRRQGVRHGLEPRLGRQGHQAARRQGRARRELRADPPLEPGRHGRAARCSSCPARPPQTYGLDGTETFSITRPRAAQPRRDRARRVTRHATRDGRRGRQLRGAPAHRHAHRGRLLPPRRRAQLRAAPARRELGVSRRRSARRGVDAVVGSSRCGGWPRRRTSPASRFGARDSLARATETRQPSVAASRSSTICRDATIAGEVDVRDRDGVDDRRAWSWGVASARSCSSRRKTPALAKKRSSSKNTTSTWSRARRRARRDGSQLVVPLRRPSSTMRGRAERQVCSRMARPTAIARPCSTPSSTTPSSDIAASANSARLERQTASQLARS